jgi:hypothetical protein
MSESARTADIGSDPNSPKQIKSKYNSTSSESISTDSGGSMGNRNDLNESAPTKIRSSVASSRSLRFSSPKRRQSLDTSADRETVAETTVLSPMTASSSNTNVQFGDSIQNRKRKFNFNCLFQCIKWKKNAPIRHSQNNLIEFSESSPVEEESAPHNHILLLLSKLVQGNEDEFVKRKIVPTIVSTFPSALELLSLCFDEKYHQQLIEQGVLKELVKLVVVKSATNLSLACLALKYLSLFKDHQVIMTNNPNMLLSLIPLIRRSNNSQLQVAIINFFNNFEKRFCRSLLDAHLLDALLAAFVQISPDVLPSAAQLFETLCHDTEHFVSALLKRPPDIWPLAAASQFLDTTLAYQINQWANMNPKTEWKLIYDANNDRWQSARFSNLVNKQSPTVVIVHTAMGEIIGGYKTKAWNDN